ncbi:MAG: ArsR family transcriptional regulator [Nitrospirae bacterium]|nr:ArsR family transcriptional regulator [Nitrospirota bacterium]
MSKQRPSEICNVVATIRVIAGKWKPLILWHLFSGTRRFGELRRLMPEVTEKMLVQQLRELEADELVRREVYPQVPPKVEYSLTDHGRTIRPVLNQMSRWGQAQIERTGETHEGSEESVETVGARPRRKQAAR